MSLGDMTWLKAIATTLGIFAYGVVVCLMVGLYFARQSEKEEQQHEPDHERAVKPAAAAT
jgi:hypothetical protein